MIWMAHLVLICVVTVVGVGIGAAPSWMLLVPPVGIAIGFGGSWIRARRARRRPS